jgi:ATP-dependent DNA helicase RecG
MTATELLEIIHNGENSGVEFKRDDIDNRELAKELVAFTNFQGGSVLLGVEDDGTISGITRTQAKLEEWVMQACRDKMRPEIIPFYEVVRDVEAGKDVAVVTVPTGYTVHAGWHNQHRTYYIRVGTLSREASQEELERLFQQRGSFRVELRPVSGATFDELDIRRLRDYFERIRAQPCPPDEDRKEWIKLLINTEMMTPEGGNLVTVGGLLLFGKTPNRFLPQAGISAAAFPGDAPEYDTRERATLRGPLVALGSPDRTIDAGVIEQAMAFLKRNIPDSEVMEELRRVRRPGFPEFVFREAIVNAMVHRDYLLSATDVQLSIFSNRIEIVSPGRLPNGITVDRMRTGCRAARNQLIKDTMQDFGYLESMGMGIPRKIILGLKEFNGAEPDLRPVDETFTVVLPR